MKTLYLFTSSFPFSVSESFLEDEIRYLSQRFERIVILPFYNGTKTMRPVPYNCEVYKIPLGANRIRYIILGFFHPRTVRIVMREFLRNKVYQSKTKFFAWGASVRYLNNCLYNGKLRKIMKGMKSDDVCYFYWGIGQCLLSIVLKGKVHLVSRFHGEWDLWEEMYGGFHSLRTEVARSLDTAVFISKKGEQYFTNRYPNTPTVVFPLGTKDYGIQMPRPNDAIVRVISCSKVYPLKRVPLIFEALNSLSEFEIEWTHIGDGQDYDLLKHKVATEKKDHLTVNLLGYMSNEFVLKYYSKNHFDVFINLSKSEGVPVSIMEAESFGIPIIATDVGGTSEEVPAQAGVLISSNPTIEEIIFALKTVLSSKYSPREFWATHYNAEKNYTAFAEMIYALASK